jgi:putative Mg2+ transporter-C (MgtC) family protein
MPLLAQIALNLAAAWLAGSLIGLERSYDGRVAGFRTHGLVALATATTISIAAAPKLLPGVWPDVPGWLDPSRLVQGVMAGIGFLGAGVIFKEGVSIQGLTTAASIYATAAIGLALGLGLFWPGALATAAVLISLTLLARVEALLPFRVYTLATFRFAVEHAPTPTQLVQVLGDGATTLEDVSYRLTDGGKVFEFRGALTTRRRNGVELLVERLRTTPGLLEFDLMRISK